MVAAILAALGAAVAVIVIVAVVFAVRSRTSTPYAGQKKDCLLYTSDAADD